VRSQRARMRGEGLRRGGARGVLDMIAMLQDSARCAGTDLQAVVLTTLPVPWPFWIR